MNILAVMVDGARGTPAEQQAAGWVGPGLVGFVVIMALVVGTVLLWRNMNKHLKRVTFDEGATDTTTDDTGERNSTLDRADASVSASEDRPKESINR